MSCRIATKSDRICSSCPPTFRSSCSNLIASSLLPDANCRSFTKALIIAILAWIARLLRRTPDNMATPCSVKALGNLRVPPQLDVPNWNFNFVNYECVNCSIKSSGNLSRFLDTALLRSRVETPYRQAKSLSRITRCPRSNTIVFSTRSGTNMTLL